MELSILAELMGARSQEEFVAVLNDHPKLREEATVIELLKMVDYHREAGIENTAQALEIVLQNLLNFPDPNQRMSPIVPTVRWAIVARECIGLLRPNLDESKAHLENEPEILRFLEAYDARDDAATFAMTEPLVTRLHDEGRDEESLTIHLIHLFSQAPSIQSLDRIESEKKEEALANGIVAFKLASNIAGVLQDSACQALALFVLAEGFDKASQFFECELSLTGALATFEELAKGEPKRFLKFVAMSFQNLGNAQRSQGKRQKAEASYNQSVLTYRIVLEKDPTIKNDLGNVLNQLALVQLDLRKHDEADNSLHQSLSLYESLEATSPRESKQGTARALINLGNVRMGERRYLEAEELYAQALNLKKTLNTEPVVEDVAMAMNNLAYAQEKLGRLTDAASLAFESLEIRRALANDNSLDSLDVLANTLANLAKVKRQLAELDDAERLSIEASEIYTKLAETDPRTFLPRVVETLDTLATTQRDQLKGLDAENSYESALRILNQLDEMEPEAFSELFAIVFHNRGTAQQSLGKFKEAERSYRAALEIYTKLAENDTDFRRYVAASLNNLATTQRDLGRFAEAAGFCEQALEILRDLDYVRNPTLGREVFGAYVNLAGARADEGDVERAESAFDSGFKTLKELEELGLHILPDKIKALSNLGHFRLKNDSVKEATRIYQKAIALVEEARENYVSHAEKTRLIRQFMDCYDGLLACHIKSCDLKHALDVVELSKSRTLTDLLNLKAEDLQPKSPTFDASATVESLGKDYSATIFKVREIESFERQLSVEQLQQQEWEGEVERNGSQTDRSKAIVADQIAKAKRELTGRIKGARQKRLNVQSELARILSDIREYDPGFPPKADSVDSEAICALATESNRTIVIFRVMHAATVIIFVFPNGDLHAEELIDFKQDDSEDLLQKWLSSLWEFDSDFDGWLETITDTLFELDRKLISKVRNVLDKSGYRSGDILFIPSRGLALLPLHAACREERGKVRYLLQDYCISYCSSVSVFNRCVQNGSVKTGQTLGVISPTRDLEGFATDQISMLEAYDAGVTVLAVDRAIKAVVVDALEKPFGVIHFYCHGQYRPDNPFEAGLIMADNEKLKLIDIMNRNLRDNWLTVLAACETGMVEVFASTDDFLGLPIAFILAGSPSIWASLWSVNASRTSDLMQTAYRNLKRAATDGKAESLRQAQLELLGRESTSHPYYWAGFQHIGV